MLQLSFHHLLTSDELLQLSQKLPGLIQAVERAGQSVTWICDPMHGNTESCNGFKTRRYEKIRAEVRKVVMHSREAC